MKIIKPSVELFGAVPTDYVGTLKFIEMAGRTCYKSEDKITPDSAENFVRKLIKAGHLAMVEHSNFVIKARVHEFDSNRLNYLEVECGKFLNMNILNDTVYMGGNLTAWYQQVNNISWVVSSMFKATYGDLFGSKYDNDNDNQHIWEVCPFDEIPQELHRYSARFICDRGVSHELVRHRPCSFAQESTRYVNYAGKDMEFIEPTGYEGWDTLDKGVFEGCCKAIEQVYKVMINNCHKTPQQARAVLPNALKTEIVVTADLAEWQHIFKLRCHKSAHPDMVRVMTMLKEKFIEEGIISEQ